MDLTNLYPFYLRMSICRALRTQTVRAPASAARALQFWRALHLLHQKSGVGVLFAIHDWALGISPVTSYSGVKDCFIRNLESCLNILSVMEEVLSRFTTYTSSVYDNVHAAHTAHAWFYSDHDVHSHVSFK